MSRGSGQTSLGLGVFTYKTKGRLGARGHHTSRQVGACHSRDHDGGHLVGDDGLGLAIVQAGGLEGVHAE